MRSDVARTFSMRTAKFRGHVRSNTDAAITNEVLCKLLARNLCGVISNGPQSMDTGTGVPIRWGLTDLSPICIAGTQGMVAFNPGPMALELTWRLRRHQYLCLALALVT